MMGRCTPLGGGFTGRGHSVFEQVISLENLLIAWKRFRKGKQKKADVQTFEFNFEDNLFKLRKELECRTYRPDPYTSFYISDPKLRHIHKASVRDRLLFQAVFQILYPIFDKQFIFDVYSSRNQKGTHRGVGRLQSLARKVSRNYTRPIYALKCDIRKFFDSVDHRILAEIIRRTVLDSETLWLIDKIVGSFETAPGRGVPLGNVTSQLFANIYLNELDQFVKHKLKAKCYVRYCDDFVILSERRELLISLIPQISSFLSEHLKLELNPAKVIIRKLSYGIDFLGYVILPHYVVLRTKTKRRILRRVTKMQKHLHCGEIEEKFLHQSLASYAGLLTHCHGFKIKSRLLERAYQGKI